jgi:arylsulfatase
MGWKLKQNQRFDSSVDTIKIISDIEFGAKEFVFINLMNAHAPYNPPQEYKTSEYDRKRIDEEIRIDQKSKLTSQKKAYEDVVNYLSDKYKEIFESLRLDFDYIFTVSDHGELFGEHGTGQHYFGVYPELTHVPINIYHEDLDTQSIDETVSLLDIHKTILDIAGIDAPSRGQNLIEDPVGREYLTESHGLRTSQLQTLKDSDVDPEYLKIIDQPLRGIAMPDDYYGYETPQKDFIEQGEATVSDPQSNLEEIVENMDINEIDDQEAADDTMSEDVKSQLQDLGYM